MPENTPEASDLLISLVEEYLNRFAEPAHDGKRNAEIINSLFGFSKDSPMATPIVKSGT